MNITQEENIAAGELVELIALKVGDASRVIRPETVISASARLAGSFLLCSFDLDLDVGKPGSMLLSDEANEQGPILINIVGGFLSASSITLDREKVGGEEAQRGEAPRLSTIETLSLLQDEAIDICNRVSLNMKSSARAVALATAFVVKECSPQIGPEIAFNVAMFGFIEGSKTIPPASSKKTSTASGKSPWYKIW